MLFFLLQMKLKNVVLLFSSLGVLFLLYLLVWALTNHNSSWQREPDEDLSEGELELILQRELDQAMEGEVVTPRYPHIPVMVWWTPFSGDLGLQHCGKHRCYITSNRSFIRHPLLRNIFFYGTDFKATDVPLPRGRDVDWSLYHEESPKNNPIFSHAAIMELFNHTATFREESDFSLVSQYLSSLETITDGDFVVSLQEKNRLQKEEGLAPVAYVQSGCDTPIERDKLVSELMKHVAVDSYGACLHNKDLPEDIQGSHHMASRKLLGLLAKYKFVISIENAACSDYVTEKLWRTLQIGSVPIYLGAPNIERFLPNPNSAILLQDFSSVEAAANYIRKVNGDDGLYLTYLQHKAAFHTGAGNLISNSHLKHLLDQRRWGVTSRQQLEMGNSVEHFQCMVCQRVATNLKMSAQGFRPRIYISSEDHYGCLVPTDPITGQVNPENWFAEEWFKAGYQAQLLNSLLQDGDSLDKKQFDDQVLRLWLEHRKYSKKQRNKM